MGKPPATGPGEYPPQRDPMETTERSTKAEIITASLEIIDDQSGRIAEMQERQAALWCLVALLTAALLMR
jgi:hypothetical protein